MPSFWPVVNQVIRESDILLLLLDARMVDETRNKEVEDKVKSLKKPLIYVITKCDLVEKDKSEEYKKKLNPCVFISSKDYHGMKLLRERIIIEFRKAKINFSKIRVGVLGYPNVGKSSLINAMSGRSAASTSPLSGHTKGVQKIRSDNKIYFLDTPGVIPYKEKDYSKHAFIGSIDHNKVKNPDLILMELMEKFPGKIESHFDVDIEEDKEETLEKIGKTRNILKRGGEVDIQRLSRMILADWQKGKIK